MSVATMSRAFAKYAQDEVEMLRKKKAARLLQGDASLTDELSAEEIMELMSYVNKNQPLFKMVLYRVQKAAEELNQKKGILRNRFW